MAIDMKCPHCAKGYRLKDEMAGKRVQCANAECRKPFLVEAAVHANGSANGTSASPAPAPAKAPAPVPKVSAPAPAAAKAPAPKPPAPAPKAPAPPHVDAEALAAAALNDDADAVPVEARVIKMICVSCDHKWDVAWDMQGKNVLCPDCRTRQKVPVQKDAKKADWRESGRPSLAKVEELEGVQASTNVRTISGETIRGAKLIEEVFEPRPISFYVKIASAVILPLIAIVGGYIYMSKSRKETFNRNLMDTVINDSAEDLKPYPMFNSILLVAAAEYESRLGMPAEKKDQTSSRDKAVRRIGEAVDSLKTAPKIPERDYLLMEAALVTVTLGGEGEALKEKTKLNWLPNTAQQSGAAKVKPSASEQGGVYTVLRQVFTAMQEVGADVEVRNWAARRIARDLIAVNQIDLADGFYQTGFSEDERMEIEGQIGMELVRAGKVDEARKIAERIAASMPAPSQTSPSAHALLMSLDPPVKGPSLPPPGGGLATQATRIAWTVMHMSKKNPDEALKLASSPGPVIERLRAITLAAEYAENPGPFLDAAQKAIGELQTSGGVPPSAAVRLALMATKAGADDKADLFIKRINDEGLRVWAKSDTIRERSGTVEESAYELPSDEKKSKPGHAWGRYLIARSNIGKAGKKELEKQYSNWAKPFVYFGRAGIALGHLDAAKK